jgi:hypothetical protein
MSKTPEFHAVHSALLSTADDRQAGIADRGCEPRAEVTEEDVLELEEDVGVLRLMLFQAALRERRILESQG